MKFDFDFDIEKYLLEKGFKQIRDAEKASIFSRTFHRGDVEIILEYDCMFPQKMSFYCSHMIVKLDNKEIIYDGLMPVSKESFNHIIDMILPDINELSDLETNFDLLQYQKHKK